MLVFLTLFITKTILHLSRWLGRGGGSALPGLVAERIDPKIASKLVKNLPEGVVVVTGTNGKTTTTKMLAQVLNDAGKKVITNRSGSNLTRGVASALIEHASLTGHLPYELGLFEVDEATMPAAVSLLQPKVIVVLNLFRDQLDRYGELDTTARIIGGAVAQSAAEVYLNADDPLVASLASYVENKTKLHYFGVESTTVSRLSNDRAADSDHCPNCGRALEYANNFFGHIGHYKCPSGDLERPEAELKMLQVHTDQSGTSFEIEGIKAGIKLPGLYNAYNALAALAVAGYAGIKKDRALESLQSFSAAFGRVEITDIKGRKVYLLLIKNPTGFNQVIQTFFVNQESRIKNQESESRLSMLIAINDNFADGRDVSWLWDVAIEELAAPASHEPKIIVSGIRAADMALRLKYVEIPVVIQPDLRQAVKQLIEATPVGETAYILPTYTAMLEIRRLITKEANLEGFWK